ncbi:MAG TPA: malto-oligosyltrehalose synthase [Verrucomicrobiae bacterium]|jgi:(1->4)-alpha-D-glucan 1-alpha-D-glucosylmutase|nr:malto-oligosyltrehalose synthase [Verrucomicrobiae bacterium]
MTPRAETEQYRPAKSFASRRERAIAPAKPNVRGVPRATYRFQFNPEFTLSQARELVPYLAQLGITHVYASPLLKACSGSMHGYDICDFQMLNPELGAEKDLKALHEELARHSMGLILDIVPNHMGIASPENRWWRDVLTHGKVSRYAGYFDIDWRSNDPRLTGKVVLPILADRYHRELERGHIQVKEHRGALHLQCGETNLPVCPATLPAILQRTGGSTPRAAVEKINETPESVDEIVRMQNYAPMFWRTGDTVLNYRRFFTITSLAGIRIEEALVFEESFATVKQWLEKGWVNGLRVDHTDGLRDPEQYLHRLRAAAPRAWIVIEKILEPGENLCESWPINGTTGYDFLNDVCGLFIDPKGEKRLSEFYREITGDRTGYAALVLEKKRRIIHDNFAAETNRLTGLLLEIAEKHWRCRDFSRGELCQCWTEIAASLPVYRTYVGTGRTEITGGDSRLIHEAAAAAGKTRPELPAELFDFIEELLLFRKRGTIEDDFVLRFQQLTGAIMAKAVEDTAFYCYGRFIVLNEVGGDPSRFGFSVQAFHQMCRRRQEIWPESMNSVSTHDTKRGADVRARMSLLSQMPQEWAETVRRWMKMNEHNRTQEWPGRKTEYFLYQTLVGAWPLSRERILDYMLKAVREAKENTDWSRQVPEYERALKLFVEGALDNSEFMADLKRFVSSLEDDGRIASLAQTLLQLTAPGVPDVYQGGELWDLTLADPDNRRPIDFARRKQMLATAKTLEADKAWQQRPSGMSKLWLILKVLEARRNFPDSFGAAGQYEPLPVRGAKSAQVVAFARGGNVVTIAPRLVRGINGEWADTGVELPAGRWRNALTGDPVSGGDMNALTAHFPVALLIRE